MDISATPILSIPANKHFRREVSLTSRESYDFYRANRKNCPKAINQYNLFVKAVEGIFRMIQMMVIESEAGVYIEGLGYFANVKVKTRKKKFKSLLLKAKTHFTHTPYFFPDGRFSEWTMSGTAKKRFKHAVTRSSIKYRLRKDLAQSLTEAQKFAQKAFFDKKRHGYRI